MTLHNLLQSDACLHLRWTLCRVRRILGFDSGNLQTRSVHIPNGRTNSFFERVCLATEVDPSHTFGRADRAVVATGLVKSVALVVGHIFNRQDEGEFVALHEFPLLTIVNVNRVDCVCWGDLWP